MDLINSSFFSDLLQKSLRSFFTDLFKDGIEIDCHLSIRSSSEKTLSEVKIQQIKATYCQGVETEAVRQEKTCTCGFSSKHSDQILDPPSTNCNSETIKLSEPPLTDCHSGIKQSQHESTNKETIEKSPSDSIQSEESLAINDSDDQNCNGAPPVNPHDFSLTGSLQKLLPPESHKVISDILWELGKSFVEPQKTMLRRGQTQ